MTKLQVEQIPVLNDNYVYLLHQPESGVTGVVDPAVAAPVLARLREQRLDAGLDPLDPPPRRPHRRQSRAQAGDRLQDRRRAARTRRGSPASTSGLVEGDRFELGALTAEILETPGHTSGHISYWFPEAKALFCADTLFSLGCGRVFEGSFEQMWSSLSKLAEAARGRDWSTAPTNTRQTNARFALTVDPDNPALKERAAEVERLRACGQADRADQARRRARGQPVPPRRAIRRSAGGSAWRTASDAEVFAEIRRRKDRF